MSLHIWDYNTHDLKKSKSGRLLLLERLINFGIYRTDKKKIPLKMVKNTGMNSHLNQNGENY